MEKNSNLNKQNDFKIKIGTRLTHKHWGMSKHGFYLGRDKVICYEKNNNTSSGRKIKITTLKQFYENG